MYKYFISGLLFTLVLLSGCGENPTRPVNIGQTQTKSADNEPAKEIIWPIDGAKMVLIPEGSFQMGDA